MYAFAYTPRSPTVGTTNCRQLATPIARHYPDGRPQPKAAHGKGNRLAGVAGTLWAGFNGVTEWIDHRQTRQNASQRLTSAWFGESARIKSRAFSVALDKVAAWN